MKSKKNQLKLKFAKIAIKWNNLYDKIIFAKYG